MKLNVRIITEAGVASTKEIDVDRDGTFDVRVIAPDIGKPIITVDVTPLSTQAPRQISLLDLATCAISAWNGGTASWWPVALTCAAASLFLVMHGSGKLRAIPWRALSTLAIIAGFTLWASDVAIKLLKPPPTPLQAVMVMR